MALVTDTWGTNRNPTPKVLTMYKILSATAVSGEAVTDTGNFYNKDCPFPIKILGFEAQCISVSGDGFSGSGSALTVALQRSTAIDSSPATPTTTSGTWNTVVTVNASGSVSSTNKMLFSAPGNVSGLLNPSMVQAYVAVPKGGSLRATLSAQARDAIGVSGSTPVELLTVVTYVPTATKNQIYN